MTKKPANMNEMGPYFSLLMRLGVGMFLSITTGFAVGLLLYRYCWQQLGVLLGGLALGLVMGFIYLFREIQRTLMDHNHD